MKREFDHAWAALDAAETIIRQLGPDESDAAGDPQSVAAASFAQNPPIGIGKCSSSTVRLNAW